MLINAKMQTIITFMIMINFIYSAGLSIEFFFITSDPEVKETKCQCALCVYEMGLGARKPVFGACKQQRHRPACASAQSDQRLCHSHIGKYHI